MKRKEKKEGVVLYANILSPSEIIVIVFVIIIITAIIIIVVVVVVAMITLITIRVSE